MGIALKKSLWDKVKDRSEFAFVPKESEERYEAEEGILFVFRWVKWYVGCDKEIDALCAMLLEAGSDDGDDYLIVPACFDHPNEENGIEGAWYENPWSLNKNVSVELTFEC